MFIFSMRFVYAQDIIVLKDGSTVLSKVIEVGRNNIKYKKWSYLNGPDYVLSVDDIISINYQNGDKDTFSSFLKDDDSVNITEGNNGNAKEMGDTTLPDNNNASLLNIYNSVLDFRDKKNSGKIAKEGLCKFGITKNSVLSSRDLEISIIRLPKFRYCCQYGIVLKNKSKHSIYIDLGNTFKITSNGVFEVYFDNSRQVTVNKGGGNGFSLGLGSVANALGIGGVVGTLANGVSIGQKSESSTSISYSKQRVLVIPPLGKCFLAEHEEVSTKKDTEYLSHGEQYYIKLRRGMINRGTSLLFTENNSPWKQNYIITYSDNESFLTYKTVEFGVYIQQVFGTKGLYLYGDNPNEITSIMNDLFNKDCQNQIIVDCFFKKDVQSAIQLQ